MMLRGALGGAFVALLLLAGCDQGDGGGRSTAQQTLPTPIATPVPEKPAQEVQAAPQSRQAAPQQQPAPRKPAPPIQAKPPAPQTAAGTSNLPQPSKRFDFYVLALSWSPSYCAAEGTGANEQQCGMGRPYAFVVHGLWPQFARGFPSDCDTQVDRVPNSLVQSLYDIMPSAGLIGHQWRRHGSCTGLSPQDYFDTLRAARERVRVPEEFRRLASGRTVSADAVEAAFIEANPGLQRNAVSTTCDQRFLREVRLCLSKELQFRACPELERRACHADQTTMPPVRGG